jgi:hypothetical protein
MRETMEPFLDLPGIEGVLRAAVLGEGESDATDVVLPLYHPRKTGSPDAAWVEWRRVDALKQQGLARYPHRFRRVEDIPIHYAEGVYQQAADLADLNDMAALVGEHWLADPVDDLEALRSRYAPMWAYLLRTYHRD